MSRHELEEHELIEQLKWLIHVRYGAVFFAAAIASIVHFWIKVSFGYIDVLAVIFIVLLYNFCFSYLNSRFLRKIKELKRKALVAHRFLNLQSVTDIAALTVILRFTGSIESPFAFYYIFHLILLGILLSKIATYLQALFAMALFTGVVLLEFLGFIEHIHPEGFLTAEMYQNPVYVGGNLFVLYTTVFFSIWLTVSIIRNLRKRERQIIELTNELERRAISCEIAYEELQQTTLEKARYVRKVSHELKSPLAAIQSLAQTILSGYTGDISINQKKLLTSITMRTSSMSKLIMDMLTLTKSREMLPLKKTEPVDIGQTIKDIIRQLSPEASSKKLQITTSIEKVPEINAYKDEIFELFKNLLENAVNYSHMEGKISIVVNQTKKGISIALSDNGIGIPQKELNLIFEEFYRTEEARKFAREGTGLGLSIVKQIIEKHKGKIEVYSKPGIGSTFTVFLPLQ